MPDYRTCDDCTGVYDADTEGKNDMCGHCMIPEEPYVWNDGLDPFEIADEHDRRWA
jgi:hypothetical protein